MNTDTPFKLDHFVVTPAQCSIQGENDEKNVLQPKFIDVLTCLAAHYPDLVSREVLIDTLWDGNYPVGEKALTNAIWNLRQQLKPAKATDESDPQPQNKQYIETIRKRGYRLTVAPTYLTSGPLTSGQLTSEPSAPIEISTSSSANIKKNPLIATFAGALMLIGLALISSTFFTDDIVSSPAKDGQIDTTTTITAITTAPGRELFPVVSPDGRYLVYVWRRIGQRSNLYIKDLTQTDVQPRQLTFNDALESRPIWSHDGQQLYFVQKSSDKQQCDIIRMTLVTHEQQVVAHCPGNHNISISLSHDDKTLAYTGISEPYNNVGIYLTDLTDLTAPPVRFSCGDECAQQDRNFAFSPDGLSIAVSRRVESLTEDIFLVNLKNKQSRQLTFGEGDIIGLVWHPDSQRLVYATVNSDAREGYIIDLKDGSITPLNVPGFSFPDFVGDTDELVYHDWRIRTHIAYLPLAESMPVTPFPVLQSDFSHRNPDYSINADRLVYVSNESGHNEIWTAKTDGSSRQKLTNMSTNLAFPRWSHDGKNIVFLGPKKDKQGNNLYILDANTRHIQNVPSPFDQHKRPAWLHDDSAVIAVAEHNNDTRLYAFKPDGGKPQLLLDDQARFVVQTADQTFWYSKNGYLGLWQFNPKQTNTKQTSKPQQILDDSRFGIHYNWTVTDKGVYYQHDHTEHQQINYYDFANRKITPLIKVPLQTLDRSGSMTHIPGAQQIIFNQSQYPQVDIKRLKHPLLESLK